MALAGRPPNSAGFEGEAAADLSPAGWSAGFAAAAFGKPPKSLVLGAEAAGFSSAGLSASFPSGCTAAASGWDGRLVLRLLARDGWPLRRQMARASRVLSGRSLPRVWQMQGEIA